MKEITEEQLERSSMDCQTCATPIWVFAMPFGTGNMPRMEAAGIAYVGTEDQTAIRTMTYRLHECSGERPIDPETGLHVLTRREVDDANAAASLGRRCPKCDAIRGEECFNLSKLKRGIYEHTNWPHAERLDGPLDG